MPTTVQVPEVGDIEFPDSMSQDEIRQVVSRRYGKTGNLTDALNKPIPSPNPLINAGAQNPSPQISQPELEQQDSLRRADEAGQAELTRWANLPTSEKRKELDEAYGPRKPTALESLRQTPSARKLLGPTDEELALVARGDLPGPPYNEPGIIPTLARTPLAFMLGPEALESKFPMAARIASRALPAYFTEQYAESVPERVGGIGKELEEGNYGKAALRTAMEIPQAILAVGGARAAAQPHPLARLGYELNEATKSAPIDLPAPAPTRELGIPTTTARGISGNVLEDPGIAAAAERVLQEQRPGFIAAPGEPRAIDLLRKAGEQQVTGRTEPIASTSARPEGAEGGKISFAAPAEAEAIPSARQARIGEIPGEPEPVIERQGVTGPSGPYRPPVEPPTQEQYQRAQRRRLLEEGMQLPQEQPAEPPTPIGEAPGPKPEGVPLSNLQRQRLEKAIARGASDEVIRNILRLPPGAKTLLTIQQARQGNNPLFGSTLTKPGSKTGEGGPNAPEIRTQPEGGQPEHIGVPQGTKLPAHEGEIRQGESGQAGGGGGAVERAAAPAEPGARAGEVRPEGNESARQIADQVGMRFDGETMGRWMFTMFDSSGKESTSIVTRAGAHPDEVLAKYYNKQGEYGDQPNRPRAPKMGLTEIAYEAGKNQRPEELQAQADEANKTLADAMKVFDDPKATDEQKSAAESAVHSVAFKQQYFSEALKFSRAIEDAKALGPNPTDQQLAEIESKYGVGNHDANVLRSALPKPTAPAPTPEPTPLLSSGEKAMEKTGGMIGMGGAAESELSRPTIEDLINPSLREKISNLMQAQPEAIHNNRTFMQKMSEALTSAKNSRVSQVVKGWLGTVAGKSLPKTTLRDRQLGEEGARFAASRAASGPMSDVFVADVLTGLKVDPVKFDAALKADNLLSVQEGFRKKAVDALAKGDIETAGEAIKAAAQVNTLLGAEKFPFKNEKELREYFNQADVAEAVNRHVENWNAVVEPMYKEAAGIDPTVELPTRGKYSGARVNLNPVIKGQYEPSNGPKVASAPGGTLTGTMRRKSPFARQAKGTGQEYRLDYQETMANTFAKQLEIANKRRFDDRLVSTGNAVIAEPGKQIVLPDGEATKSFPFLRRGFENKNIYVRRSLATEYAHASDVVLNPYRGSFIVGANQAFARSALFGLTDATVHIENLGTAAFQVPGTTGLPLLSESLLSAAGRLDIPVTIARGAIKAAPEIGRTELWRKYADTYLPDAIISSVNRALLKNMTQMAALSEINASRMPHGNRLPGMKQLSQTVQGADRTTRMVLDDGYKNLVRQGLVRDTETNRREFVNQAGNYNMRTQGAFIRFLRQTWFSPFITAGRNFASLGVRAVTLNPGVEASSNQAAAALRASMLAKWIGSAALVGTLNYLITGKLGGRKGTPFGSIDTGSNDANGNPVSFNALAFTGQSRALRTIGARGYIQSRLQGLPESTAESAAMRDVANTALGSVAGPGVRFAMTAATGYPTAVGVGRTSQVVPPGERQWIENLRAATMQANPLLASVEEARKPGGTIAKAVERQLPRFSLQPAKPAQTNERYPQIVSMAQANEFTEWMVGAARSVPLDQRAAFVQQQISRLPPDARARAFREVLRRRVFPSQ